MPWRMGLDVCRKWKDILGVRRSPGKEPEVERYDMGWENRELEYNIQEGKRGRTGDRGARLRRSDLS